MSVSDWIVSGVVIAAVLFAALRAGQVNPVGTGRLVRRQNALERRVGELSNRIDGVDRAVIAIAEKVVGVTEAVEKIDTSVMAMRVEAASDRGLSERTWQTMSRLEGYFIEDSFRNRGRP